MFIKGQFNLGTDEGRRAYENVKFFREQCEWSIGYAVVPGRSKRDSRGIRHIFELALFEYSTVLVAANPLAMTLSVKSQLCGEASVDVNVPDGVTPQDIAEAVAQVLERKDGGADRNRGNAEQLRHWYVRGAVLIPGVGWTTAATVWAMPDVRLAISESAATGTATVLGCQRGRFSYRPKRGRFCYGTFVYDATGEAVQVSAHRKADPGDVYAARITPEGDKAGLRDVKGVLAHLSDTFGGLLILGLALMVLVYFAPVNTLWPFMSTAGAVAVVGLVGSVAGIIASNT